MSDNLYRALKTTLDSSTFGLAQAGDIVLLSDGPKADQLVKEGQLEKVVKEKNEAQYFVKVEEVAEKAVEVADVRKPGRPAKEMKE